MMPVFLRGPLAILAMAFSATAQPAPGLEALRPEFYRLIEKNAAVEKIATGFKFTEGPVWNPGGFLLFSDIYGDRIHKWSPASQTGVFREEAGFPNGLTYDQQGRLLICNQKLRRLERLSANGEISVLAEQWQGKRLNCPNDVVVREDGTIYFTDPYWKFPPGATQELSFQAVFRISPDGKLHLEAQDFGLPNGIAFAPGEKTLYVGDTRRRKVYALDVAADGSLSDQRLLADLQAPEKGAVDGMKVDERGNIFTTGPGGIWVITPEGQHLGTIRAPEIPANCAWGDRDYRTLYMAAPNSVYRVRTRVRGLATYNLQNR